VKSALAKLTRDEKIYLRVMKDLEEHQEPITDQSIVALAGWKSIATAWKLRASLLRKGYIEDGERLVRVRGPRISNRGRKAMKLAA
jgi:hypothetical protein